MSAQVDENAIAQRVLTILAESLLGAGVRCLPELATDDPPEAAGSVAAAETPKSITAFCKSKGMSRAFFYALKRKGLAPRLDEITAPGEPGVNRGRGLKLVRITAESERAWDKQMEQLRASEAAELEAARARDQRLVAGKLAAQSPLHVSRRNQQKTPRHGRR
jgi:hypothetical protein